MARTVVGLNDAKAVKRFSGNLAVDTARKSYFNKKFMGVGEDSSMPIQMLTALENDAGEQITYDLSIQLRMQPVEGDNILENQEEALSFYTDQVYIDQMRGGVNVGGRMTRKRTLYNLRMIAKKRQSEWWARVFDELFFMYLSGSRGINSDYIFPLTYTGFANNALSAPDYPDHQIFGAIPAGVIPTSAADANFTATNSIMSLRSIDRLVAKAQMMGGGVTSTPQIQPIMVDGEERYVLCMTPWDEYNLRTSTTTGQWLDIQKALTTQAGVNSPIFKGGMGMYNDVVLHKHKAVIRFSNYGAAGNVTASRCLFLGEQGAVCAFGSPGTGLRYDWNEETRDNGNQIVIATNVIFGIKKCTFNSKDYGVIAADHAAADPG